MCNMSECLPKKRCIKRFLLWILAILICLYLLIFGLLPIIVRYSPGLQKTVLFMNWVNLPDIDSNKPPGTRNFYLTTDDNVTIGAWQILPYSLLKRGIPDYSNETYENILRNAKRPVFLYMHGNGGNRASGHRLELYQLLQRLDFHVISFDYRSYGDSSDVELSEIGVVNDSAFVLGWLMKLVNKSAPIFVWGHSLGTAVSLHVLARFSINGVSPAGLFLEAAFNSLADEAAAFASIFTHLPWFHWAMIQPMYDNGFRFESYKHIKQVECPIMILHAEDDNIVPYALGKKLYISAKSSHPNNSLIQMTTINATYGLGHNYIVRYKYLPKIINNFVAQSTARLTLSNL